MLKLVLLLNSMLFLGSLKTSIILIFGFKVMLHEVILAQLQSSTANLSVEVSMHSESNALIKSVTLLAKEETLPPLGVPQQTNRNVGFASVFIRLENSRAESIIFLLKKIEICDASTGKIIMTDRQPQEMRLHPLENSENVFHLKNKTGYRGHSKVKAIITYEVDSQTHTIESAPVEIERL